MTGRADQDGWRIRRDVPGDAGRGFCSGSDVSQRVLQLVLNSDEFKVLDAKQDDFSDDGHAEKLEDPDK